MHSIFVKHSTASKSTVNILLKFDALIVGYFRSVNNSSEEKSEKSAAENELATDAANSTDESDDAEDVCIGSENLFDDE